MEVKKISQASVNEAVAVIDRGDVVIFPTDTVYGFLADAGNKKAVEKIYKIKKRPDSKLLPVFVKDLKMAKELAEIDFPLAGWPGKVTYILKRKKGVKLYDGGEATIALRIPKHKPLNDLLKKINKPLAQTSVNISGQPPLSKISDIIKQFQKQDILLIDGGNLSKSNPSTIIDLTENKLKKIR